MVVPAIGERAPEPLAAAPEARDAARILRQFGRHARSASREMREIASDCRTLLDKTGVVAPALHQLYRAIDAYPMQR